MGRRGGRRLTAVSVSAAAVVLLAAGCAAQVPPRPPARARPSTVERLAAAAGCAPAIQTGAAGLREGSCLTARGSYVLATFPTTSRMRAWLAEAHAYSGSYLVGERWVVAGPAAALRPVRARLGGRFEPGARQDR